MAKCSNCQKRKAKRRCPALRSDLCPLCCGLLRDKQIQCPPTCRFLAAHRPYQEKKILERRRSGSTGTASAQDDILKDERLAWLALNIEAPLQQAGERNASFADGDALLALEYAKDKLVKSRTVILISGEERKPRNAFGEAVFQSIENCKYERNVILATAEEGYRSEEKIRCLDHVLLAAKAWARENSQGRAYIAHLQQQFARITEMSRKSKILTPR